MKMLTGAAIAVGVVALAGAVWFAYQQGIRSGAEDAAPVIRAEADPIKRKPEEPGGLEVPHQDKLVFGRLAPGQVEEPVEKLLPPPEQPAERPTAPAESMTAESTTAEASTAEGVVAAVAEKSTPAAPPETASAPAAPPPPPPKPITVEQPPVPAPPTAVAAAPASPEPPKAAPAPAKTPAVTSGDRWRIQLASVSSRDRALSEWDRLKTRNTDLLGTLTLNVQSAELSRGTFYRIQAGPLAGRAAASDLCGKLKSRNQDCLVVAP